MNFIKLGSATGSYSFWKLSETPPGSSGSPPKPPSSIPNLPKPNSTNLAQASYGPPPKAQEFKPTTPASSQNTEGGWLRGFMGAGAAVSTGVGTGHQMGSRYNQPTPENVSHAFQAPQPTGTMPTYQAPTPEQAAIQDRSWWSGITSGPHGNRYNEFGLSDLPIAGLGLYGFRNPASSALEVPLETGLFAGNAGLEGIGWMQRGVPTYADMQEYRRKFGRTINMDASNGYQNISSAMGALSGLNYPLTGLRNSFIDIVRGLQDRKRDTGSYW